MLATPGITPADRSLWPEGDFVKALNGRVEGAVPPVDSISIDSRTVERGGAFFAIAGDRFDGHDFVEAALQKGAAVAVVSEARRAALPARTSVRWWWWTTCSPASAGSAFERASVPLPR